MKQKLLAITASLVGAIGFAQYEGYNTWSIEANGGLTNFNQLNTGTGNIYSPGYLSAGFQNAIPFAKNKGFGFNPLHLNLGVRKMLSPGFGFRLGLTYDNIESRENAANKFEATYIGADLQMVVNINKLANANILWNRVNFLVHGGLGYANMSLNDKYVVDDYGKNNTDNAMSVIAGFTTQIRIIDRLAFNIDMTNYWYGKQQMMLDGSRATKSMGFVDASSMNLTAGLTFYLGKNGKHIDWYEKPVEEVKEVEEVKDYGPSIEELMNRIKALEARPVSNNIGDVSGLQNRIKELENQIKNLNNDTKNMMDANIIHAYFDFDKDQPKSSSQRDIQTAIDYLKNNPSATMELVGYADKVGPVAYNENLSKRRVENIKAQMVKAGIDASRLTTSWKGSKDSTQATAEERALARKVVFRVK